MFLSIILMILALKKPNLDSLVTVYDKWDLYKSREDTKHLERVELERKKRELETRFKRVLSESSYLLLSPKREYYLVILHGGYNLENASGLSDWLTARLNYDMKIGIELKSEYFNAIIQPVTRTLIHSKVSTPANYEDLVGFVKALRGDDSDDENYTTLLIVSDPFDLTKDYKFKNGVYTIATEWVLGIRKNVLED